MSVMDTVKSFKGYGKVDEAENQQFQKKTRKRWIIIGISSLILIAVVIAAATAIVVKNKTSGNNSIPTTTNPSAAIKSVCSLTMYPDSCYSSLLQASSNSSNGDLSNPLYLSKLAMEVALRELEKLTGFAAKYAVEETNEQTKAALADCESMFDDAIERLNDSVSTMETSGRGIGISGSAADDVKTWLSATVTDLETCIDGLDESNFTRIEEIKSHLNSSSEFASNCLAIITKISKALSSITNQNRKLLELQASGSEYPSWMRSGVRRLLEADVNPKPNVTVAKDGSGNFTTLKEAVALIPKKGKSQFVIYVKSGKYVENVVLDKSKWNVVIYGDGKTKTIISGGLNFIDGTPTFSTATFAAVGKGFFAKDIRFENTAGAEKHQAVAFRSGADESVFYRCAFDAFQDTLYPHSNRQFYRDCDITGTIDFIFGNAAVVFQNCLIQPREPLKNQFVTITAQGKKDPNQNTGISIQGCTFSPLGTLTAPTYLGRPWKDYSTTVIMQSMIGSFLRPVGWIEWVRGVVPPSTIYYAEYQNNGPGANTAQRVTWPGYKPSISAADAAKFTVGTFIRGAEWLPSTKVAFKASLTT